MAKTEPQQKTEQFRGSLFKTAVVASPIAIGGGIGLSRLSKRSSHFGGPVANVPHNAAIDTIRQFSNRYANLEHSGVYKDWQLNKLAGFMDNVSLPADHIRSMFNRAVNLNDPTGKLAAAFSSRLNAGQTSAQEVLRDILSGVERSNSIYLQRAMPTFVRDLELMQSRAAAGLSTDLAQLAFQIPLTKQELALTPSSLRQLGPGVGRDILKMSRLLGANVSISRVSRQDLAGSELKVMFRGGKLPSNREFALSIPEVLPDDPNIIVSGATLQSRRIAGQYAIVDPFTGQMKQSFNHTQWTARRALEDFIPSLLNQKRLTASEVNKAIHEFELNMLETADWIPSMGMSHEGIAKYEAARKNIMRLYKPSSSIGPGLSTVENLTDFDLAKVLERGSLATNTGAALPIFPGHSPAQVARNVVATQDVRDIFSLVPSASEFGRRPLQALRQDFIPTESAIAALSTDAIQNRFAWASAAQRGAIDAPILATAFVPTRMTEEMSRYGISPEGQVLVAADTAEKRAVRQWTKFNLNPRELGDIGGMLQQTGPAQWNINQPVAAGTFLGYDPLGNPVITKGETFLSTLTGHENAARGKYLELYGLESLPASRFSKVYGLKAMAAQVSGTHLENIARDQLGITGLGVESLASVDYLKKNRHLHYNQMFTALWDFTKQNYDSGKKMSVLAANFAYDPNKVIGQLEKIALKSNQFSHEGMLKNIFALSRGAGLTSEQMGSVFGAVPDIFGAAWMKSMPRLSKTEQAAIEQGVARGFIQMPFGGLGGSGAGGTGTIEPRMFELLSSPHFGAMGSELQQDILLRMKTAYPHRLFEEAELTKSLQSLLDPKVGLVGLSPKELIAKMGNLPTPLEAANLNIPGIGNIYIPGAESLGQLAQYKTASGQTISSDLSRVYSDVITSAQDLEAQKIGKDVMRSKLSNLATEVAQARSLAITGSEGLLRNAVPGSMFLTATLATRQGALSGANVGITRAYAHRMFTEMEPIYGTEQIASMRKRFMAGEAVAGVIGRHPAIGPYSTQAVKFQLVPGEEAVAVINENLYRASVTLGEQEAARMVNPIRLSPLPGLSGDVDGDVVSAMFAGPQLERSLASHIEDYGTREAYENYAIRSQLLKAKAAATTNPTLNQLMGEVGVKLGMPDRRVGALSNVLSQYRAAVLSGIGGLGAQEAGNALGLLEWLEQTPISGKHIAAGQATEMIGLLDDIQQSLNRRNAGGIQQAVQTILKNADPEAKQLLFGNIQASLEGVLGKEKLQRTIPGIDLGKTTENLSNVMRQYEASAVAGVSAARARSLFLGKVKPSIVEQKALLESDLLKMSPFGALMTPVSSQVSGRAAMAGLTMGNQLAAAGKSALVMAKPLLLGTGAAIGLATILSEPKMTTGPVLSAPRADMSSGSGGADIPANVHPDAQIQSSPSAPNMMGSANKARVSGNQRGYNVRVSGRSNGRTDYNALGSAVRNSIGGGNLTTNVRDNRSSLTPQNISDILSRG